MESGLHGLEPKAVTCPDGIKPENMRLLVTKTAQLVISRNKNEIFLLIFNNNRSRVSDLFNLHMSSPTDC